MAYIKRDLEQVVSQLTQEYPVILITGPSQVGKNTMLQNLMQGSKRTYVSLEDYEARYLAKTDYYALKDLLIRNFCILNSH